MRLIWSDTALDKLSDFYVTLTLDEQDVLERTVKGMNAQLRLRADQLGESRTPWVRVWFEGGLMVRFELTPAEDVVTVYDVIRVMPKKR
jgi:hypothetical protein